MVRICQARRSWSAPKWPVAILTLMRNESPPTTRHGISKRLTVRITCAIPLISIAIGSGPFVILPDSHINEPEGIIRQRLSTSKIGRGQWDRFFYHQGSVDTADGLRDPALRPNLQVMLSRTPPHLFEFPACGRPQP